MLQDSVFVQYADVAQLVEHFTRNEAAFFSWLDSCYPRQARRQATIVILGLGAVGEPLAQAFAREGAELVLIDRQIARAMALTRELRDRGCSARSLFGPDELCSLPSLLLVVYAAGKEGSEFAELDRLFACRRNRGDFFVDLRPQLQTQTVSDAAAAGWRAFCSEPMDAHSNYALAAQLARALERTSPDFPHFEQLVLAAS